MIIPISMRGRIVYAAGVLDIGSKLLPTVRTNGWPSPERIKGNKPGLYIVERHRWAADLKFTDGPSFSVDGCLHLAVKPGLTEKRAPTGSTMG
ncbi:hypothetical protein ACIGCH_21035 [Pseudomonas helleri]|uniref:Uncharacterized protein n=1 Tax=Pseudomonas helleri TaxID=1608996 RepID=A0A7X1Y3Y9_9PSED|nr:hypothetical protein [Pseudomonas helleri]MQU28858.1 hypothetical protein [Pseudomonas helleri]